MRRQEADEDVDLRVSEYPEEVHPDDGRSVRLGYCRRNGLRDSGSIKSMICAAESGLTARITRPAITRFSHTHAAAFSPASFQGNACKESSR